MVLSSTQRTETALEISKVIPPEKLAEVSRQNKISSLEEVADVLAQTYTPAWIFYYLSEEADGTEEVGEQLVSMTSVEDIEEEIDNKMEQGVSINLRNPADQNWMSDDPLKSAREEFESQKQSLRNSLQTSLEAAFESPENVSGVSEEDINNFAEQYAEQLSERVNYVKIHLIKEEGNDPATVILREIMSISLAKEVEMYLNANSEEDEDVEVLVELLEIIELPSM
jgi:hypothetical protein